MSSLVRKAKNLPAGSGVLQMSPMPTSSSDRWGNAAPLSLAPLCSPAASPRLRFSQRSMSPTAKESSLTLDGSVSFSLLAEEIHFVWLHHPKKLQAEHSPCALFREINITMQFIPSPLETCLNLGWITLWTQDKRKWPQTVPGEI